MTDDRVHRAVPLRADEATYLTREAGNRGSKPCCPHLDVFHNRGKTADGGDWCACDIWGCGCLEEDPPRVLQRVYAEQVRRAEHRDAIVAHVAWFFIGGVVSVMAMVVALWLRGTP